MTKDFRELKFSNIKFILLPFLAFLLFSINAPLLNKSQAQTCLTPGPGASPRAEGLITTPGSVNGLDNPSGTCIIEDQAARILLSRATITRSETYQDLKNAYFTKARVTPPAQKKTKHTGGFIAPSGDVIYEITNDLTVAGGTYNPPIYTGIGTQIYFIDGSLTITDDIKYSNPTGGIVFVVQGNIDIYSNVTQIDAVLIAQGVDANGNQIPSPPYTICTNYDPSFSTCADPTTPSSPLVVNGSLISLNKDQTTTPSSIKFKRTLADNTQPAEKVNAQPKYLIILKGLMSSDLLVPISAK